MTLTVKVRRLETMPDLVGVSTLGKDTFVFRSEVGSTTWLNLREVAEFALFRDVEKDGEEYIRVQWWLRGVDKTKDVRELIVKKETAKKIERLYERWLHTGSFELGPL